MRNPPPKSRSACTSLRSRTSPGLKCPTSQRMMHIGVILASTCGHVFWIPNLCLQTRTHIGFRRNFQSELRRLSLQTIGNEEILSSCIDWVGLSHSKIRVFPLVDLINGSDLMLRDTGLEWRCYEAMNVPYSAKLLAALEEWAAEQCQKTNLYPCWKSTSGPFCAPPGEPTLHPIKLGKLDSLKPSHTGKRDNMYLQMHAGLTLV